MMRTDVDFVKRAESGNAQYSKVQIQRARKHLDVMDMPLSELEIAAFKRRLYIMYDHIKDRRFDEAKAICKELAPVLKMNQYDDDLPQLHRLFEAQILIYADNDLETAEKKLTSFGRESHSDSTAEQRYHYNFNKAAICTRRMDYEASFNFYRKALKLSSQVKELMPEDIKRLHLGIASCYTYLEFPFKAISHLETARDLHYSRRTSVLDIHFDIELALNYIRVNELKKAERLLEYCLICANSIKSDFYIGNVYHNFGRLYMKREQWEEAINYFNRAGECFEEGSGVHLRAICRVVYCWSKLSKFAHAKRILKDVKHLSTHKVYGAVYEAMRHYVEVQSRITLYNEESVEYIETKALPHFEETHDHFLAIEYYKLLEAYYAKKNDKKALSMSESIRRIYERCLINVDERDIMSSGLNLLPDSLSTAYQARFKHQSNKFPPP